MTPQELDLVSSFVRERVGTGWADPEWPTDADLTRIADEVETLHTQKHYPFIDGPHLVIGPECFTGDGNEVSQDVISWRGENYYVAARARLVLTQEEAALAVEAVSDLIQETYDRESLRRLGALAHKLDPDFPAPEDDDEDAAS